MRIRTINFNLFPRREKKMFKFNLKNFLWALAGLVLLIVAVFFIVNWLVNSKNNTSSESA
ncbi:MAG: hypothetical protein PWP75_939 [Caldanaerobacter sp.]|nr:hypothetical protein [Caldanaerobacter sp.]